MFRDRGKCGQKDIVYSGKYLRGVGLQKVGVSRALAMGSLPQSHADAPSGIARRLYLLLRILLYALAP
jgi:hypothetical protein